MKVGMIGAGFIASFQARAMAQVRGLEVGAILRRRRSEELARLCRELGLGEPRLCDSVEEVARHAEVAAVYAPNPARLAVVEELAAAVGRGVGLKGVICEKPLARNLAEGRRMVELARGAGLRTAYFENQLFMSAVRAQRRQLAPVEERMGPPNLVRSAEEHSGPHEAWFWDPVRQGGGVLSDMGCHSIAVGRWLLTPAGRKPLYLEPVAVQASLALLKWGRPEYRQRLQERFGVDYGRTPAEDFATGTVTYRDPADGRKALAQFTNSWMFDMQGLRILMEGLGPGYSFEFNTLRSPLTVFVGDEAAESLADSEGALEKATASRGLIPVHPNEADLYGYTEENRDMLEAFGAGRDAFLDWNYGLETLRLVMAAYLAHERGRVVDLTDPATQRELDGYVPLIQRGRGAEVL